MDLWLSMWQETFDARQPLVEYRVAAQHFDVYLILVLSKIENTNQSRVCLWKSGS